MQSHHSEPLDRLGKVLLSPGAQSSVSRQDLINALQRHLSGGAYADGAGGHSARSSLIKLNGCRFLTAHRGSRRQSFWLITEADGSRTTVLLPQEF